MDRKFADIRKLHSELDILRTENIMLSERAEDMMLMSMISEIASSIHSLEELIPEVLERISILKDISLASCGTIQDGYYVPFGLYAQSESSDITAQLPVEENILSQLKDGAVFLVGKEIPEECCVHKLVKRKEPFDEVVLVPFEFVENAPGIFLFAQDIGGDGLNTMEGMISLLQHLVITVEERIRNIYLLSELQNLNQLLERKVEKRSTELRMNEEKFRQIFDNANDGLVVWSSNDGVQPISLIDANQVFAEMSGYAVDELTGMEVGAFRVEEYEVPQGAMDSNIRNRFRVALKRKDGSSIPTEVSTTRFLLDNEKVILGVHRDITDIKEFEIRLTEERNKAQEADELKSVFLANMSHEIRTPMNAILGFSELLDDDSLSRKERESYLEIIKLQGSNLMNLISDLLYLSRIEARQIDLQPEAMLLSEFLEQAHINWQNMLQKSAKNQLVFELHNNLPWDFQCIADSLRISQILNNLISNAIKFTSKGSVKLFVDLSDGKLHFTVEDTGIGIAKGKLKLIFERFRQADEGQSRKYGGTGLGLSICKELSDLMEAEIKVSSEPGKGSSFHFILPLDQ